MAPSPMILLKAQANKLGIDGYKSMDKDELEAAIKSAKTASDAPVKGTVTKGAGNGVAKGAVVKPAPVKGSARTSAPAKSTPQKSTPKRATAAKGTAKRQTAARATTPKPSTKRATAKKNAVGRAEIDRSQIDWKAESGVGRLPGKRQDVMKSLRKHKGNYDKVYVELEPNAVKWYPNALNTFPTAPNKTHAAQLMLRWLINRVAFDFVKSTDQHVSGERAGYGQSDDAQNVYRRQQREEHRKAREKAARAAKRNAPAKKRATASKGK